MVFDSYMSHLTPLVFYSIEGQLYKRDISKIIIFSEETDKVRPPICFVLFLPTFLPQCIFHVIFIGLNTYVTYTTSLFL